jgi:hypothetical protein
LRITSHSSRTNNSWLFTPSSLILANYYLPLNGALYFNLRSERIIKFLVIITSLFLFSCAPTLQEYHEPQLNEGELYSHRCGFLSPTDTLKLKLPDGITLTVRSSSDDRKERLGELFFIGYFSIPENVNLEFLGSEVMISAKNLDNVSVPINTLSRYINSGNTEIKAIDETFTGSTKHIKRLFNEWDSHNLYQLRFSLKLNDFLEQYYISMPPLNINGTKFQIPKLEFKYIKKLGLATINC